MKKLFVVLIALILISGCIGQKKTVITDSDNDGLSEEDEIVFGTDPNKADTDNDGINDGGEVASGTNPLSADDKPTDNDNDGMDDSWEQTHGLDPTTDDSEEDPDNDGYTNLEEYNHATDPNTSNSSGATNGESTNLCGNEKLDEGEECDKLNIPLKDCSVHDSKYSTDLYVSCTQDCKYFLGNCKISSESASETENLIDKELVLEPASSYFFDEYNNEVYWADSYQKKIFKVTESGSATTLAEGLSDPEAILVSSSGIFVQDEHLKKYDLSGNLLWEVTFPIEPSRYGLGANIIEDSEYVYTVDKEEYTYNIIKVNKNTGAREEIYSNSAQACGIALDDNFIYFTECESTYIKKISKTGGDPVVVYRGESVPMAAGGRKIKVDNDILYFTRQIDILYSIPITGGILTEIMKDGGQLFDFQIKEEYIYTLSWSISTDEGKIIKMKKDGTNQIILLKGLKTGSEMAITSSSIFFESNGKLYKINN